jgi:hypothetical protein
MSVIDVAISRLEEATLKEIGSKRCFIVSRATFFEIYEMLHKAGIDVEPEIRFPRDHDLEAFAFSVSSKDEPRYFICTASVPVLDPIWKRKFKGE